MNRRELITRFTAVVAASTAAQVPALAEPQFLDNPDPKRVIAVFKTECYMSHQAVKNIVDAWALVTAGTAWEGTKAVVLSDGMSLDIRRR